jgi:CBS domain-containing protein
MAPKSAAAVKPAMIQTPSATAKDIMQRPAIAATPRASLRDLAAQLVTNEFSGMPVVDPDGRVIGVVTESDIVQVLIAGKQLENLTASEVMTSPAISVDVDTPLDEVMKMMLVENHIVRVPVTNQEKLVGIISRRDIIRAILEPEFVAFGSFPTRW